MKRCCRNPNNYYRLATFSGSRVDPFSIIFLKKRVLHTGPQKDHSEIKYFCFLKKISIWGPRVGGGRAPFLKSFSHSGAPWAPRSPRAAPGSLPGCFFSDFGINLCTLGCSRDVFLLILYVFLRGAMRWRLLAEGIGYIWGGVFLRTRCLSRGGVLFWFPDF